MQSDATKSDKTSDYLATAALKYGKAKS